MDFEISLDLSYSFTRSQLAKVETNTATRSWNYYTAKDRGGFRIFQTGGADFQIFEFFQNIQRVPPLVVLAEDEVAEMTKQPKGGPFEVLRKFEKNNE